MAKPTSPGLLYLWQPTTELSLTSLQDVPEFPSGGKFFQPAVVKTPTGHTWVTQPHRPPNQMTSLQDVGPLTRDGPASILYCAESILQADKGVELFLNYSYQQNRRESPNDKLLYPQPKSIRFLSTGGWSQPNHPMRQREVTTKLSMDIRNRSQALSGNQMRYQPTRIIHALPGFDPVCKKICQEKEVHAKTVCTSCANTDPDSDSKSTYRHHCTDG